jgi:hypothetical protein
METSQDIKTTHLLNALMKGAGVRGQTLGKILMWRVCFQWSLGLTAFLPLLCGHHFHFAFFVSALVTPT